VFLYTAAICLNNHSAFQDINFCSFEYSEIDTVKPLRTTQTPPLFAMSFFNPDIPSRAAGFCHSVPVSEV